MFKNYLLASLRSLWRHKNYTLINCAGLAIGIASSIIILLFVQDELSYDRHNEKFNNIFRFYIKGKIQGNETKAALSCAPLGSTLKSDFPEVIEYTRVFTFSGDPIVRYEDKVFIETNFLYADSTFFKVFTAPAIVGNPQQMLNRPNTVVVTEETAKKYFGNEDPLGKVLKVGQDETAYEVTGVVKGFPNNSHFKFNLLGSFASTFLADVTWWIGNNNYTYIVLQEGFPPDQLEAKIPALLKKYMGPQLEQVLGMTLEHFLEGGNEYGYFIQPLKDIHLRSDLQFEIEPGGSITTVYIFSLIALFLIIIASINFMNLATARSSSRAPEVGIRKVVGSDRGKLVWQFMTESFIITFIALLLAMLLVELFIPHFNNLSHKTLEFNPFKNPILLPALIIVGILVGFLSGSYPAFVLASFKPVSVLKGEIRSGIRRSYMRSILVTLQFIITITLFISTFVVYKQMNFIQKKDLGFDKENLLVIDRAYVLDEQRDAFRQKKKKNPDILSISGSNAVPGGLIGDNAWLPEGASKDETHDINNIFTDPYFAQVYKLEIKEGRWFSENNPTDSFSIVLNESAVKALGFDDPLSKRLLTFDENTKPLQIIGVVKDFHFQSLHREIKPLVLVFLSFNPYKMSMRISGVNIEKTLSFIEETWDKFVSDQPINMTLIEDDLAAHYSSDRSVGLIFSIFAILAIFIAALGLLGLTSYSAEQRTKEVGIRKVLGATISHVMTILSKEIVWLILFATIIAWPVGYFFMKDWLQNFAFRIKLDPLIFVASTLLAFLIAIITVSIRTYRAAIINPSESLRYE